MNASPVTHAGNDRPDRKKSSESETWRRAMQPDAEHEREVERDDEVVDGVGVDQRCRRQLCQNGHGSVPSVGDASR